LFQDATITVDRVKIENGKMTSIGMVLFQNDQNQSALNYTIFFPKDVAKLLVTFAINYAGNPEDQNYQVEIFKATFDCEKLVKNIKGNFFIREVTKNILKALDFLPDFLIKAVSKFFVD